MTVVTLESGQADVAEANRPSPRTWQLFALLAAVQVVLTVFLNQRVLTPEAYEAMLAERATSAQVDEYIGLNQRWQRWGYLLSPAALAVRVGVVALLVQLSLLLFLAEVPFARVFRAAVIAYSAVLAESAFHTLWLYSLRPDRITAATLEFVPGSLASLLPGVALTGSPLVYLLDIVTLFGLGWWLLFALALHDGRTLRFLPAFAAVGAAWLMITAARWGVAMYLGRLST